jgi:hypothetical protein
LQEAKDQSEESETNGNDFKAEYLQKDGQQAKSISFMAIENLRRSHRAIDINILSLRSIAVSYARCMTILESPVVYWSLEGACSPTGTSFLVIGLDVNITNL